MPGSARSEIYFIAGMFILILILCVSVCVFFYKTYRKEMREKQERIKQKAAKSEP
jgi:F0F1-type ATP synthase membrane subunit b/b'